MKYDVIVIGCGMSGILAGIHLKNSGKKFIILEKAGTLGGTWRDNTYPGLTCDVPSHAYTYSFEPNPEWSRVLPPGAEIQQYFEGVFQKYGIADFSQFGTEITRAEWTGDVWTLQDQHGKQYQGKVVVAATGVLHHPNYPQLKAWRSSRGIRFTVRAGIIRYRWTARGSPSSARDQRACKLSRHWRRVPG